ncbi:glycosyltransferase [Treponema vincentii]|uniref:glycosyltransferase n=1 Tax=Treponema vincentii TaxID=69710 RepID=UPI0035F54651
MKICHVTSVHSSKDDRIFYRECLSLAHAGYTVLEIAPNVSDEVYKGIAIHGIVLPKNKWKRAFFSKKTVYNKCVEVNADIYHFHDPELMPVGIKLKRNKNKCVIFDSHEDVPAQILTKEWIPSFLRKFVSRIYAAYEKRILCNYDALVSVTPSITVRLCALNKNVYQLTNYPLLDRSIAVDSRTWGDSVCFAGGLAAQWLHQNIIRSIENCKNITYRLAGWGSLPYLEYLKTLNGWKNVEFIGKIAFDAVPKFLIESTAAMVLNDYVPNVGYKLGSLGNNKLFEALQMGIPVICTDFILWKEIIDEWKCGICVNPHDIKAIRDAINYLIENKDIAKQMGDNGRRAVMEKYNWTTQEKILLEMYKKLEEKCK